MPYNFELTFTQPILTKLDAGQLKDARDWANTITNAYIRTIKLGLPQGVPPTLPAPGLNPIAPPPYPITVSGYNTADSRSRIMYNVIFAYFKAKELKLNKDAIQNTLVDIKRVQRQIKQKRAEIRGVQEQIKNVTSELSSIKTTFKDIIESIKSEINNELNELSQLVKDVANLNVNINEQDIASIYSYELNLINRLNNLGSLQNLNDAVILANDFNTLQNNFETKDQTKKYLQTRIIATGSSILGWVNGINNLPLLLSKVNRYSLIYKKIKRYTRLVRVLETQLAILSKKVIDLSNELTGKLLKKLEELKQVLAEKRANKQKNRANDLFKVVNRFVTEIKKKTEVQVKKSKEKVKKINDNIKVVTKLGGRVVSVTLAIEKEVKLLVSDLKQVGAAASSTADRSGDVIKMRDYLTNNGLSAYTELITTALVQSQSDFETFKSLFESRKVKYIQIYKEIKQIRSDLQKLLNERASKLYTRVNKLGCSLKQLFLLISKDLNEPLQKIKNTLNEQKKELEAFSKKILNDVKVQVNDILKSLVPVKSNIKDPIEKNKARKEKLLIQKDHIQKIKALSKISPQIVEGLKGLATIGSNIDKLDFSYSNNGEELRKIVNTIYSIKGLEATSGRKLYLDQEKKRLLSEFDRLIVIELLYNLVAGVVNELKSNDGITFFERDIDNLKDTIPQDEYQSLLKIISLLKSSPKNLKDLIVNVEGINLEVLNIVSYKNKLLELEKYYLLRSKQAIQTALDGCEKYNITNVKINTTLQKLKSILKKEDSIILFLLDIIKTYVKEFINIIKGVITPTLNALKDDLQKRINKENSLYNRLKEQAQNKLVNLDALAMSTVFGLAARLFWTGATWVGPTGVNHVVFNIGFFKPIKARMNDGGSAMIKQIANSYQKQLQLMNGLAIPPPNLLIPPIPFVGYK